MLVFISDLHLTDGGYKESRKPGSLETLNPRAFLKFTTYLEPIVERALKDSDDKEVEIVLLGDIIDIIRSETWLQTDIRPWSDRDSRDGTGKSLSDYTMEIVNQTCDNQINRESIKYLKDFKVKMGELGYCIKITYIVGNHDWLVNRYSETRMKMSEFLGLNSSDYKNVPFPTFKFWEDQRVFARHGDIYDSFNFEGNRDASSLGDAIVIDLITRFSLAVESEVGQASDPELICQLRQIDHVKHFYDMPAWILGACIRARSHKTAQVIEDIWNDLVDRLLDIDFVKQHNTLWPFELVDAMKWGLRITKRLTFSDMAKLPAKLFELGDDHYIDCAFRETSIARHDARYVVFGHTHSQKIVPLDIVYQGDDGAVEQIYFNTGTWRKLYTRTEFDKRNYEFMYWNVMTFCAMYRGEERDGRGFEVWSGALG